VCFTEERIASAIFRRNLSMCALEQCLLMFMKNVYEKIDRVKNYNGKYYVL